MEKEHLSAQLKQLLSRGYSISDVRNIVTAPKALVDQAILEYQNESQHAEQNLRTQRHQAEYAMHLGTGR